jgi:hypothetical protein
MWEGRYWGHKERKKERKSIQTVYTYPHDNKSLTTFFPLLIISSERKYLVWLSLSVLLLLGNKLCNWIVMPVSSGWGGSGWLHAAGILSYTSFMYIDSYFLGSRYPLWFDLLVERVEHYIYPAPTLNFMQGFLFCALHGSCFESDNDSCSYVFCAEPKSLTCFACT